MLPQWAYRALGIELPHGGRQAAVGFEHNWPWPGWLTVILVAGCVALVVACYRRETGTAPSRVRILLVSLRLGAIGTVLWMIAQWSITSYRVALPELVILIDDSASMSTIDQPDTSSDQAELIARVQGAGFDSPTRIALAKTLLIEDDAALLESLSERYRLTIYFMSETARGQNAHSLEEIVERIGPLAADGQESRLGDAVSEVMADFGDAPPAAILLLTDGVTTAGRRLGEVAEEARRKQVRLDAIALGSERPIRDIELTQLEVDDIVFLDDTVAFDVTLTARGLHGEPATVTLRRGGSDEVLSSQQVSLPPDDQPLRIRMIHQPASAGRFEYEVEVDAVAGEAATANNRRAGQIEVRDVDFKVLLVQSYPSYEFRYLKEMLKRDPNVQLDYVLQEADLGFREVDSEGRTIVLDAFPARQEDLFAYDVVIFGDADPTLLGSAALENLAQFVVDRGGGLIFVAGPRFMPRAYAATPLAQLMPFDPGSVPSGIENDIIPNGFVVDVTPIGLTSPQMQLGESDAQTEQIWHDLPPMYFAVEPGALKPAARILAVAADRVTAAGRPLPIFISQYVGAGQAVFHGTDDTWRWRRQAGDAYFARYWKQSIRALSRSKLVGGDRTAELSVSPETVEHGRPVQLKVRFFDERKAPPGDDGVTVLVESASQPRQRIALRRTGGRGIFEAAFLPAAEGSYRAIVVEPTLPNELATDFFVRRPLGEADQLSADISGLRSAARLTGGKAYRIEDAAKLVDDLRQSPAIVAEQESSVPIWNWWLPMAAVVGLLTWEWILRKRHGML